MPAPLAATPGQALDLITRALSAVDELTALIQDSAPSDAIVIAAAALREIRPALVAAELTAEVLDAARQAGWREGFAAGQAEPRTGLRLLPAS